MIKERENPLLLRKRVTFEASFDGATPKKEDILKLISASLKAPEDSILIRHIYPKFGDQKAKVIAHVYSNKEDLKKIEAINKKKKVEEQEKPKKVKDDKESKTKKQETKPKMEKIQDSGQ